MVAELAPWAIKSIEKLQKAFLWQGMEAVSASNKCRSKVTRTRPIELGGLGIIDLTTFGYTSCACVGSGSKEWMTHAPGICFLARRSMRCVACSTSQYMFRSAVAGACCSGWTSGSMERPSRK
ncbi:hypothetical protein PR202_ga31361 [Eleusine coracana subsp. coracana]|uniref:Uncharacterized protein n=1 Tax=Eleusine coracana subsp. coracana TaxID=191504 RepID=A0AAV5DRT4_ELECO|nr:hypothetical protein PR202_ga31361 [Eleusine coracana subsp. coracana]